MRQSVWLILTCWLTLVITGCGRPSQGTELEAARRLGRLEQMGNVLPAALKALEEADSLTEAQVYPAFMTVSHLWAEVGNLSAEAGLGSHTALTRRLDELEGQLRTWAGRAEAEGRIQLTEAERAKLREFQQFITHMQAAMKQVLDGAGEASPAETLKALVRAWSRIDPA